MKNYRLFLLGFMTASLGLLTGFEKPGVNNVALVEKQAASIEIKKVQSKNKESPANAKHKKTKTKHSMLNVKNSVAKDAEVQKPLDMSIPFKDPENAWLKTEQSRIGLGESSTIFSTEKKKSQPLDLDGQMLMSQEPEVDKRKSLDGAGIVINLER